MEHNDNLPFLSVDIPNYADIKKKIADHLKVEVSDEWEIIDYNPEDKLYQIHYSDEADKIKLGHLRGVVVHYDEVKNRCVTVCKAFHYTPIINMSPVNMEYFTPENTNAPFTVIDNLGQKHTIDFKKAIFKAGHETVTIRKFMFNGKIYDSTYRRLNIYGSKYGWYKSVPFHEMYDTLEAPKGELFFDTTKKYSPYVHIVLLVHKDLFNCTKEPLPINKDGYPIYIGYKKMWENEFSENETDNILKYPSKLTESLALSRTKGLMIHTPPSLKVAEVNNFLKYGWYGPPDDKSWSPDARLYPGEFVIGYLEGVESKTIVKIESVAYSWRASIRNNNPDYLNRFYQLMESRHENKGFSVPNFVSFDYASIISTINQAPLTYWPNNGSIDHNDNIYNVWVSYIMSVPMYRQKEVAEMLGPYLENMKIVENYLHGEYVKCNGKLSESKISELVNGRSFHIIQLALNHCLRNLDNTEMHGTIAPDILSVVKNNISYLVSREKGSSLNTLASAIKKQKSEN